MYTHAVPFSLQMSDIKPLIDSYYLFSYGHLIFIYTCAVTVFRSLTALGHTAKNYTDLQVIILGGSGESETTGIRKWAFHRYIQTCEVL